MIDDYDAWLAHVDAGVLPNDPAFGPEQQRAVADLPEVTHAASFAIMFVTADKNDDFWPGLVPTTPSATIDSPSAMMMISPWRSAKCPGCSSQPSTPVSSSPP